MNKSATEVPYGVDEFELAGLEKGYGSLVKSPFVKASPINVRRASHSIEVVLEPRAQVAEPTH